MSKKDTAIKQCKKIQKQFSFILKDKILLNDYDKENHLSTFVIFLLINQIGRENAFNLIKTNNKSFVDLFLKLEQNNEINNTLNFFKEKQNLSFEEIENKNLIFSSFYSDFINFIKSNNLVLSMPESEFNKIVCLGLTYILYSLVDCQFDHNIDKILKDPKYEYKLNAIINNTKLFSHLKSLILKNCGSNISDLIGLINGLTPKLAHD